MQVVVEMGWLYLMSVVAEIDQVQPFILHLCALSYRNQYAVVVTLDSTCNNPSLPNPWKISVQKIQKDFLVFRKILLLRHCQKQRQVFIQHES